MKRYMWALIGISLLIATACTDEILMENGTVGDKEGWVTLQFGHRDFEDIKIQSRYTLDAVQESYVRNLFVYVFSDDGQRIYSHYFDSENLKTSANGVDSANENCWWVQNRTTSNNTDTYGTIKIKAPAVTNGKLYIVANINDETLRLSAEKLNTVRTIDELLKVEAYLAAEVTSRTPSFPMVAEHTVDITNKNNVFSIALKSDEDSDGRADLIRLDAKVEVNMKISNVTNNDTLVQAFIPASWKVVNLPRKCYLLKQGEDYEYDSIKDGYFKAEGHFETTTANVAGESDADDGFSFYMLENRESAKKTVSSYHDRELRIKNPVYGTYDTTDGMWEYAPEWGTYLEIKGELQMYVNPESTSPQLLTADVVYWVHLGNFGESINDYNIKRNTHYTYNITLKGVRNIEVEVQTSDSQNPSSVEENQPGAMGDVYAATEELYTFDAHYGQRVYCLSASQIDVDQMTWYVKTPFGREGTPKGETGTDVPDDLDYKWVKFLVNKPNNAGTAYSLNNRTYPGNENQYFIQQKSSERLMDVIELLKFIRQEKVKYSKGEQSAFLEGKIYVTAFVDEFYYEKHPLSGIESPTLWKQFVNKPNRLMHILCDNKKSLDGSSSATGSIITIRQRSIQTPYNVGNDNLTDAWGCETTDEFKDSHFFFYGVNEQMRSNAPSISSTSHTSQSNGLYNTFKLLGDNIDKVSGKLWSRFVNYDRPNDYPTNSNEKSYFLQDNAKTLLHSVMMRNRDNNGNGYIDIDELRWYVASIEQLQGIYIGELGIDATAAIYSAEKVTATGTYETGHRFAGCFKWREHVVSSTKVSGSSNYPIVLWAEEGVSTSTYRAELGWNNFPLDAGTFTIRCARNLGLGNHPTSDNIDNPAANVPAGDNVLIKVSVPTGTINTSSEYAFDLTNMNEASLRQIFYENDELPTSDEKSALASPYQKGFVTGPLVTYNGEYDGLKPLLDNNQSPHTHKGYRVPNLREVALMYLYCNDDKWWDGYILSSTYYSAGYYGSRRNEGTANNPVYKKRWIFGNNYASLSINDNASKIRLVKDRE